jgi:hypothetical protein
MGLLSAFSFAVLAATFLVVPTAPAQTVAQKKALLKTILDASAKIPAGQKRLLSAGAQNFLHVAEQLNTPYVKGADDGGLINSAARIAQSRPGPGLAVELSAGPGGTTRVSDPGLDFLTSVLEGFTQSETSTAWCGNNVVAGYNDSGAFLRTAGVNPAGAWSFNGVSVSVNGGKSFKDLALLNPGGNTANFLEGDPVSSAVQPSSLAT